LYAFFIYPTHNPWFDCPNNIRLVQVMKLLIVNTSTSSTYTCSKDVSHYPQVTHYSSQAQCIRLTYIRYGYNLRVWISRAADCSKSHRR
jgi:hypothetical protein